MMDDAISSQTLSNPRTFPLNLHVSHSDLKKSMIVDYSDEKNLECFGKNNYSELRLDLFEE